MPLTAEFNETVKLRGLHGKPKDTETKPPIDIDNIPQWEERVYNVGDLVRCGDVVYRCFDAGQSHRSPESPWGYHSWEYV
jgi:hypothetical protein